MAVRYREEPCRSALNRVKGMPFAWSLNPYTGCVHRCTFCYVRAFEQRADRPADDRYGRTIRVKTNVADVLRAELARRTWAREEVTIGAATDPYQPAEGRYRLTRACIVELARARTPTSIITRGPLVWRDVDVLQEAARRAEVSVNVSVPTLDDRVWRTTEPGTAPPRKRLEIVGGLSGFDLNQSGNLSGGQQDEVRKKRGWTTELHGAQLRVTDVRNDFEFLLVLGLKETNQAIVLELLTNGTDQDGRHAASEFVRSHARASQLPARQGDTAWVS